MAVSYDELLTWDEIPEEQLLPDGGWLLVGTNVALIKPREEGQALKILFSYKAKSPVDVPEELVHEMGDYDFTANQLTSTIFVESARDWDNVRRHLELHGIEIDKKSRIVENGKLSFAKSFRGSEVVANVGSRPFQRANGDSGISNTLSKFQRVEE